MDALDLQPQQATVPGAGGAPSLRNLGDELLLMLATAVGYGVAAWGGLILLTGASGIAIFWPASGLAAGLAIALGRSGFRAVALGTVLASIVVNVIFGRSFWLAASFGLLNAIEALMVARLLEPFPERAEAFGRIMRVLAFFAAAVVSTAISGLGAALLIDANASDGISSFLDLWRTWSLSDLIGIIVVAPLLIALYDLARSPDLGRTHDWKADIAILIPFFAVAYHTLGLRLDDGTWASIAPGAALLPLLLLLSARSQPIVPALAIVILAAMMAWFAAAGTGRYGDARLPHEARVIAAQVALGTATIVAQVVMALYADRRLAVRRLHASEMRLAAIVDTAPGVIFSAVLKADGTLRFPFVSSTSNEMLGIPSGELAAEPARLLDRLDPADRRALMDTFRDADPTRDMLSLELPLRQGTPSEIWIEIKARAVIDSEQDVIWHGFIQDITMRRRRVEELGHRTRNLLSVTQAIAELTARHTPRDDLTDVLTERLSGLAASHQLLAEHHWEGAELEALAKAQLSHLSDLFDRRLFISGPRIVLQPAAAQIIGMAIHELATNACKYGALSTEQGIVKLSWSQPSASHRDFRMCWLEEGGKPLAEISRKGFGSKVTIDMPANQLGAKVTLEPRDGGLIWCLIAPAEHAVRRA
jgi:two-component sensor histidine kinase/integral membrane sensor domain MASE1